MSAKAINAQVSSRVQILRPAEYFFYPLAHGVIKPLRALDESLRPQAATASRDRAADAIFLIQ
jgi:hypothetical protein